MLPALIFDLDGTLWDACKPIGEAWTIVGRKYFGPDYLFTEDMARKQMGKTMDEIANALCMGEITPGDKEKFVREAFDYETVYLKDHPGKLFDKELEVLCRLKEEGYPLYIVSNCQAGYIETFLPLAPSLFIDHMCWSDTKSPKSVTIRKLMERNGIAKAIYIGDTDGDADAARGAGIPFLHADYGFGTVLIPDAVATRFDSIPEQVRQICKNLEANNHDLPSVEIEERFLSKYLTSTQIELLRQKVEALKEEDFKSDRIGVVVLADSFVRDNKKADAEYEAFHTLLQNLITMNSDHYEFEPSVMAPMPIVFLLVFFQYLVLLGVYNETDMSMVASPFAEAAGNKSQA